MRLCGAIRGDSQGQVDLARIPGGLALSPGCRAQGWLHGNAEKAGVYLHIAIFL